MLRMRIAFLVVLQTLSAGFAAAAVSPSSSTLDGAIALQGGSPVRIHDPERQAALAATPRWRSFRARHGAWRALWNEATGSPHRAYGRPIPLPGFAPDPASLDRSLRAFVNGNPGVFGPAPDLKLVSIRRSAETWLARYRQRMNGLPVLFSDWDFRIGPGGRLFAFGADVQTPGPGFEPTARIAAVVAREAARQGLRFESGADRAEVGRELLVLPYPTEDGLEHRVVYRVDVRTTDPPGHWLTLVDATNGAVLWRHDRVRYDVGGAVTGQVHPLLPTDPLESRPFPHLEVLIGGLPVATDAAGLYSGAGPDPATVQARLRGRYCDVNRSDALPEALLDTSVPNPSTLDIAWGVTTPADDAERDGYYHTNLAHDYVKALEPGLTALDYAMPCNVNVAGSCNAFWDGFGIHFFNAGGDCPNMATLPDVVYHEYGHGVNDHVYLAYGADFGMTNGALHEGLADVLAAFMRDDPAIGRGFRGPGTILRTIDNTLRWPEDRSGDPHLTGLIIGGAFWDLRESVGLATAERLVHEAKHRVPDDVDDGVAMHEYFLATLEADDDDADLGNGTPHSAQIIAAFNAHGIGTGFGIHIAHTPLADSPGGGSVPVTAVIQYVGPIATIDPGSPRLHWAVNDGPFDSAPMEPTGNPEEYGAALAAPGTSVVHYYLSAGDDHGQTASDPPGAPAKVNRLVVGPAATLLADDLEAAGGWTVGAAGDNALTGLWVLADPVGTVVGTAPVQPEDDHTVAGTNCWVTGNAAPGASAGTADVDGGRTTLLSPVFDATVPGSVHPMIEYHRWYSNNAGATPGTDLWRVDLSNDGGASWTPVESTTATDAAWRRVVFRIEDHLTPTAAMRLRFVAADEGDGSLVEAAVDDFRLLAFPAALVAVGPGAPAPGHALALAPAQPNPFTERTTLRFTLPATGPVSIRVFDLGGRAVRALAQAELAAGPHAVEWDGRDDRGQPLASGAYFVRLDQGGRAVQRAVVRVE